MGYLIVFFAGTLIGWFVAALLSSSAGPAPSALGEEEKLCECLE
ncbi:MAG: hypothetical protein ABFD97_21965 [Syntrophobacter sp.]